MSCRQGGGHNVRDRDVEGGPFVYDRNGNMISAPAPYAITWIQQRHIPLWIHLRRHDDGVPLPVFVCRAVASRVVRR